MDQIIEYGWAFMNDRPGRRGSATWYAITKVVCIKDGKSEVVGEIVWGFELQGNEVINAYTR